MFEFAFATVLLFIIIIVVVSWYFSIQEKHSRNQFTKKVADEMGLNYYGDLDYDAWDLKKRGISHFLENRFGSTWATAQDVCAGHIKEVEFLFFTYKFSRGKNNIEQHPIFVIPTTSYNNLPLFVIRPPEFWDGLKEVIGYKFITIRAAPTLSVQITTDLKNEQALLAQLHPSVWKTIELNYWSFLHDSHCFVLYAHNRPLPYDLKSYQKFIETGLEIFTGLLLVHCNVSFFNFSNGASADFDRLSQRLALWVAFVP